MFNSILAETCGNPAQKTALNDYKAEDPPVSKKKSHDCSETPRSGNGSKSAELQGGWENGGPRERGLDRVSLALAKGENIPVGRALPGCGAAAPATFRPVDKGDRKEHPPWAINVLTS